MQAASVVGLYGLTLLAVGDRRRAGDLSPAGTRPPLAAPSSRRRRASRRSLAGSAPCGCRPRPTPAVDGVRLRIMQPNLPQDAKFRPQNRDAIMRRYLADSRPRDGARRRGARRHAPDLAGIGLPVPARARRPARSRRSPPCCPPGRCSSPAPPAWTSRCRARPSAASSMRSRSSTIDGTVVDTYDKVHLVPVRRIPAAAARGPDPGRSACAQFVHVPGGLRAGGEPRAACRAAACRRSPPRSATRRSSPGALVPEGPRPEPDPERHQRRLVRLHARSLPAFRPGAAARRRGGPAPRPRRQYRHQRRRRPVRPSRRRAAARRARACSMPLSQKRLPSQPLAALAVVTAAVMVLACIVLCLVARVRKRREP